MTIDRNKSIYQKFLNAFSLTIRWLTPGLGVKRWLITIFFGATLVAVGFAIFILDFYRTTSDSLWLPFLSWLSLRFLDRPIRAVIFLGIGAGLILWGNYRLNRSLLKPFLHPGKPILDTVTAFRRKERGPKIVVIGGGHGLSTLLRGLKTYSTNITAIVTVADDGGSSGELRTSLGMPPPGDIRNCLAALSSDEDLMSKIFQYRFAASAGLNGHSLGNLFIIALAEITGSFEEAVAESGRVLAVQGRVLPSTLHDVNLAAEIRLPLENRLVQVKGESAIPLTGGNIQRVWLEPNNPLAYPPTVQAILSADLVVVGPGSLYTSIIPSLLVHDIAEAIRASRALKFYVLNVATQPGETDGYSASDHVAAIERHLDGNVFDLIVGNNCYEGELSRGISWVKIDHLLEEGYMCYQNALIDKENPWRHDSARLAEVIMDLFYEKTGPLGNREEGGGVNTDSTRKNPQTWTNDPRI